MRIQSNPLTERFVQEHLEALFYFCLKKTGDSHEANDLASDIALNILNELRKGTTPTHFHAWVWRIARNRYSVWAATKRRTSQTILDQDIIEYPLADTVAVYEDLEHREELALLRRELAFISSDYRNILVAYYIDNRRVKEIAYDLGLPEGTVTSKLYRARTLLKEGIRMARTFGVKSYKPEEVRFTSSGTFSNQGQPWSILDHLLYKNIFLEAYGNPQTADDLALELGIALPYMESELEFLTKQTFLSKTGSTYTTAFAIISADAQRKIRDNNTAIAKEITTLLETLIDDWNAACTAHGFEAYGRFVSYEDAKWALLMTAFDFHSYHALERKPFSHTVRPDGGRWDIVGFQQTDFEGLPFVGLHTAPNDRPTLPAVDFGQFKFYHDGIHQWTPSSLTHEEAYTLCRIANGEWASCDAVYVERLMNYDYIRKTENGYEPTIVVWTSGDAPFTAEEREAFAAASAKLKSLFADAELYARHIIKADLPACYRDDPQIFKFACRNGGFGREWVLEQALADGWLTLDDNTGRVIGAYIQPFTT